MRKFQPLTSGFSLDRLDMGGGGTSAGGKKSKWGGLLMGGINLMGGT